jgi:hypothetical protein
MYLLILPLECNFFDMINFKLFFFLLLIGIQFMSFTQEWPSMNYARWEYSRDGYSFRNFKIDVVNNSPYIIKKVKYRFYIYDEIYEKYDYDIVYTSTINLGPYESGTTSALPLPNKRYLHNYKSDYGFSWGKEILDVEFYKTPEQIQEEKAEEERQRLEKERLAREAAERERLRLEQLEKDKNRAVFYSVGLTLYKDNKLREANQFFIKALQIDPNHNQSSKLSSEINLFFTKRNGEGFKYSIENSKEFNDLVSGIKNLVNEEMAISKSGDMKLSVLISFDTLGNNKSTISGVESKPFYARVQQLVQSPMLKPSLKYGYFLNSRDKIDLNLSWSTSTEYVVSNGKGLIGMDSIFKSNPKEFKDFIEKLDYKYGNFTFEVKNKKFIIDELAQSNQNISLVKYKLNAGPQYAFYSLILPGWGSAKVSSGQRGYLEGLVYLASLASTGFFKVLERSSYSDYENATQQSDADAAYEEANSNRKFFLISIGLVGAMYVYDFSWSLVKGFNNIKQASVIKKKLKKQLIEVKTSNF